ncbi:hypothetical protein Cni_G00296 [Canna indica]|uniref:Protein MIZU-KUSSEI 1 n=1 Tax=Canna indica TaxID=4628 RepID=A0AAQ3PWB9_9LILI|nr:hypothetical protein Cni_G00296 [Canna indica]
MATAAPTIAAAASLPVPPHCATSPESDHIQQPMLNHHRRAPPQLSLVPPTARHRQRRPTRVLRLFRSLCRTLPIFTPNIKFATSNVSPTISCAAGASPVLTDARRRNNNLVTGTIFGYRKGRVSFSIQENPRCLPSLVIELSTQTHALLRDMSAGMVRVALECDKKTERSSSVYLLDEPLWTLFCNGKKSGYGVRREATDDDLAVMETLRAVSMGAGVLPARTEAEEELAYVRAGFDHVIGSRDSETLYMTGPDDGNGPDLTIFFVRL